jgi:hypothetical protein
MLDRPLASLNVAEFYVERILRARQGEIVFKRKGTDLFWCEYLYWEVWVGLVGLLVFVK